MKRSPKRVQNQTVKNGRLTKPKSRSLQLTKQTRPNYLATPPQKSAEPALNKKPPKMGPQTREIQKTKPESKKRTAPMSCSWLYEHKPKKGERTRPE